MVAIILAAYIHNVDPKLLKAICTVESGLNPDVIHLKDGDRHSIGLCQIQLRTARHMGFEGDSLELLNPITNANIAAKYLHWQMLRYDKDIKKAIIAYNRGNYEPTAKTEYYCKVRKEMGLVCD